MDHEFCVQLLNLVRKGKLDKLKLTLKNDSENYGRFSYKECCHHKSGDTLCHVACRYGRVDILRFLCADLPDVNHEQANLDGKRPLHEAAQAGELECVAFLLSQGVQVNCLKKADWTPLMLSCTKRNLCIVRALVDAGAVMSLCNKDGWTCFHIACREGCAAIVSYLLDCDAQIWNTTSKNGRTPLHTAALHGNIDIVKILLCRAGYDVNGADDCGTTPLMDAFHRDHVQLADTFIEHGADIHCRDKLDWSALHVAAQTNSTASITYLMSRLASDINCRTVHGTTPLHIACKEGHVQASKLLLSFGADVNCTDHCKRTGQHVECVKLLLDNGCNIDQVDLDGVVTL